MIEQSRVNKAINEKVYYYKAKCGLPVYYFEKKGHEKTFAIFATNFGSVDEYYRADGKEVRLPDGIAHFLEHKLFEDKNDIGALEKLASLGVQADAYTGFSKTAYIFSCTENFETALDILLHFVREPYFTDENVEKEKGIIAQEIKMYEDDPSWRVLFNLHEALYHNHPAKIDIAGTVETISKITKETLYDCYSAYYDLNNMVLCIAGDQDFEKIKEIVDQAITEKAGAEKVIRKEITEPCSIVKEKMSQRLVVAMPLFYVGFKENERNFSGKEYVKRMITTDILLEMMFGKNSLFYERLYNEGLINRSFDFEYEDEKNFAVTMIGGESKDPDRVCEEIHSEIKNQIENFDEQAFERAKKVVYGQTVSTFNSVERIANEFISWYFKEAELFDKIEVFDEITKEGAKMRLEEHFARDNSALSLIVPQN